MTRRLAGALSGIAVTVSTGIIAIALNPWIALLIGPAGVLMAIAGGSAVEPS